MCAQSLRDKHQSYSTTRTPESKNNAGRPCMAPRRAGSTRRIHLLGQLRVEAWKALGAQETERERERRKGEVSELRASCKSFGWPKRQLWVFQPVDL